MDAKKIILLTILLVGLINSVSAQDILNDGFEDGDYTNNPEWVLSNDDSAITEVNQDRAYSGDYSFMIDQNGDSSNPEARTNLDDEIQPSYMEIYIYPDKLDARGIRWDNNVGALEFDGDGSIESYIGNDDNEILANWDNNEWNYLKVEYDWDNSEADVIHQDNTIANDIPFSSSDIDYTEITVYGQGESIGYFDEVSYDIQDEAPPEITDIQTNIPDNWENLDIETTAEATDDASIDQVKVSIWEDNNLVVENQSMTNTDGDTYKATDLHPVDAAEYEVEVWANDTDGLENTENLTETVQSPATSYIENVFDGNDVGNDETLNDFFYTSDLTKTNENITQIVNYYDLTVETDNETFTETLKVSSVNTTEDSVGETYGGYENFDASQISDGFWDQAVSKGNFIVEAYTEFDYSNESNRTVETDNSVTLNALDEQGIFESALEWFWDNFVEGPIDTVVEVLNDILDAVTDTVKTILYGLLEAILYVAYFIVNIFTVVIGYILTIIGNLIQYFVFFHTDIDYQYEDSTYDDFEDIEDASFFDLINDEIEIEESETQTDQFDAPFGNTGKTFLTYNNEVEFFEYDVDTLSDFVDVGRNNQSLNLEYDRFELVKDVSTSESDRYNDISINSSTVGVSTQTGIAKFNRISSENGELDITEDKQVGSNFNNGEGIKINENNRSILAFDPSQSTEDHWFELWNTSDYTNIDDNVNTLGDTDLYTAAISKDYTVIHFEDENEYRVYNLDDISESVSSFDNDEPEEIGVSENHFWINSDNEILKVEKKSWTIEESREFEEDLSDLTHTERGLVVGSEDGYKILDTDNLDTVESVDVEYQPDRVNSAPAGDFISTTDNSDNTFELRDTDNEVVFQQDRSNFASFDETGELMVLTADESTEIYYLDAENPEESNTISIVMPLPKFFDPLGVPFGMVKILNVLFGLTATVLLIIPDPIIEASRVLFTFGLNIITGVLEIVVYVASAINWITSEGFMYLKYAVYGFVGIKALRYFEMLQDDRYSTTYVLEYAFEDLKDVLDTLNRLAENSYIILDRAFNTMIEILKTLKQYIPFI